MNNRSLAMLMAAMQPPETTASVIEPARDNTPTSPEYVFERRFVEPPNIPMRLPIDVCGGAPALHEWQRMQSRQRFANLGRR